MSKKFISIVLVLAIAVSMFAMTAFAAEPRAAFCSMCGKRLGVYETWTETVYDFVSCPLRDNEHTHYYTYEYSTYGCGDCDHGTTSCKLIKERCFFENING